MDLEIKKTIEYKGPNLVCTCQLDKVKNELSVSESLNKTLIVSLKEDKKHVTYSLDEAEEKVLYLILRKRNGH